jgi:Asp-tRNA(Asn)/Glu-tRNA(Gln) amidotransferase A subunit family amidase
MTNDSHEASAASFDLIQFTIDTPDSPQSSIGKRWSISDYVRAYTSGKITPSQVAEYVIEAIKLSDKESPPLRAIIQLHEDDIRAQAKASTLRYQQGKPLGIFDGVPVPVKDEMDVKGFATTVGTTWAAKVFGVAEQDSACVAK